MDKKFLRDQMIKLETNYGKDRFKITKEMFELWYEMFKDFSEEGIKSSVNQYIRENEYPPTIAGIMKIYREKDKRREDVRNYVKGNYSYVSHWCNEKPNSATYELFSKKCFCVPLGEIENKTDNLVQNIMDYYNNLEHMDNAKKLYDFLKDME